MYLSVFDLDKTLLNVNCSQKYYSYLLKKKVLSYKTLFKAILYYMKFNFFDMTPDALHVAVFEKFLKNRDYFEISSFSEKFCEKYFIKFLNLPIFSFFEKAKRENHFILILSNSPDFLVSNIAKYLKPDEFSATEYLLDDKNKIANIKKTMSGEAKAQYIQNVQKKLNIKKENTFAYTDSFWDLPIENVVGKFTCVNPDKKLKKIAKEKRFEIV